MPRLRNVLTGVVISCSKDKATRLGGEWRPAEKPEPKPAQRKSTRKSSK